MSLFPAYGTALSDEPKPSSSTENSSSTAGNLPRFTSFQPPAENELKEEVITIDDEPESDVEIVLHDVKQSPSPGRRKRKHRHKLKERKENRKRRRSSSSSLSEDAEKKSASRTVTSSKVGSAKWALLKETGLRQELSDQDGFILDNRRDIENLRYDTVYKTHLAKFSGYVRQCFGSKSERIDRLFFGNSNQSDNKTFRYFSRRIRRQMEAEVERVVVNDTPSTSLTALPEFFPLDNKTIVDGETFVFDAKLQMYRPMAKSPSHEESTNVNFTPISSVSDLMAENMRLNRQLTDNPQNTDLWREFLRLQDKLFRDKRDPQDTNQEKTTTNAALLERKLSVLDRAIEKHATSVELKILRLYIGRDLGWDQNRCRDEWRRIEFTHINDPSVWIGRLQFDRGGQFSKFSCLRQGALYDHCLERFFTVLSGQLTTHPPPPNAEERFVDFILAKVRFLFDSGHNEHAVAGVQALMEFNYKQPAALTTMLLDDKRRFFEPFWDSNQPRLGEEGALGWSETVKRTAQPLEPVAECSLDEDELCQRCVGVRDAGLWLELERLRESKQWLPWRCSDEPEDPQRVVLYDDIVGILYQISSPHARFRFVLEALLFCGMNFPSLCPSTKETWYHDEDIFDALQQFPLLPQLRRVSSQQGEQILQRLLDEMENLLSDSPLYQHYVVYSRFYRAAVILTKENVSSKEKLKRYKNIARKILDDDRWRDSIVFYHAYACGLMTLGAFKESAAVCESALNAAVMSSSKSSIDYLSILGLICIWTENALFNGAGGYSNEVVAEKVCLWLLNNVWPRTDGLSTCSGSTLLKAKKCLSDHLEEWKGEKLRAEDVFLTSWLGSVGSVLSHINALLTYTLASGNLNASRDHYAKMRELLKSNVGDKDSAPFQKDLERLWTWEVELVQHHLRVNSSASPRLFIQCLESALHEYPANAQFLKLYVDKHLSGQLMVKLRRFFDRRHENWSSLGRSSSRVDISWIAAIYAEFARYVKLKDELADDAFSSGLPAETNRMRLILNRAVDACPTSVVLWRLKLTLENYLGERLALKRSFYLAIRQCPWAKDLYTDAIGTLPDEGQSIVDLMIEKGIRVRIPWEELLLLRKAVSGKQSE